MGLLSHGTPLGWREVKPLAEHVREHGITQLLFIYHRLKDVEGDYLKARARRRRWGCRPVGRVRG